MTTYVITDRDAGRRGKIQLGYLTSLALTSPSKTCVPETTRDLPKSIGWHVLQLPPARLRDSIVTSIALRSIPGLHHRLELLERYIKN